MVGRQPNESLGQFAIRRAWETGNFWSPENPDGWNVQQDDLRLLTPSDSVVVKALISMSKMDAAAYSLQVKAYHDRAPNFDGAIGPAMTDFLGLTRCPVPDHAPPPGVVFTFADPDLQQVVQRMQTDATLPAIGSGNWQSCHNIGAFHCATVGLNLGGLPDFLKPAWLQVLTNVRAAYAETGLLWRFIEAGKDVLTGESFSGVINTELSFVNRSDGWIGLAIVGTNEGCSGRIWCKFLATYKGGSDLAAIVTQWTTLVKHELGHNCGRGHTSGGVMNPSIVNNLPAMWTASDPSTAWLKQQFGGTPVPIPGSGPVPPSPPPETIEQRLRTIEARNAAQDGVIDWCVNKIRLLEAKTK